MLVNPKDILLEKKTEESSRESDPARDAEGIKGTNFLNEFIAQKDKYLNRAIGKIEKGRTTHYYSWGNFNLVRLIIFLIKQTGPVHCFMTSYSFSQSSIEQLQNKLEKGELLSFKVLIDNRVKTMSPIPFQMLMQSFDYKCTSVHAKVALLWNEQWSITIVTSQNATDNPKLERGLIMTDAEIFKFDYKILCDEFERGNS